MQFVHKVHRFGGYWGYRKSLKRTPYLLLRYWSHPFCEYVVNNGANKRQLTHLKQWSGNVWILKLTKSLWFAYKFHRISPNGRVNWCQILRNKKKIYVTKLSLSKSVRSTLNGAFCKFLCKVWNNSKLKRRSTLKSGYCKSNGVKKFGYWFCPLPTRTFLIPDRPLNGCLINYWLTG